jgi:type IV secretory pathway TrbL component
MSRVAVSESTAAMFGSRGPEGNTLSELSGQGLFIITGLVSGVGQATLGGAVANSGSTILSPAGYLRATLVNPSTTSGGRIVIPFYYEVSGVP